MVEGSDGFHQGGEIFLAAFREELVFRIMVVHSVGEKDSLGVDLETEVVGGGAVAGIFIYDLLDDFPEPEVALAVLLEIDVASPFGCFREVVDIFLLPEGKLFPAGDAVAHDFEIREFVDKVPESGFFCLLFSLRA